MKNLFNENSSMRKLINVEPKQKFINAQGCKCKI